MRVLAGDVGGTKTLLAVFEAEGGPGGALQVLHEARLASAGFPALSPMVASFLRGLPAGHGEGIAATVLGVPGPVEGNRARLTNLPWEVDGDAIARETGIARARLVNDFVASARGALHVSPDLLAPLHDVHADPRGVVGILGAGTGLGEAFAVPRGTAWWDVFPSEGGHAAFAPRNEIEDAILRRLRARHGRVSLDRVLSGPGLAAIYECLRDEGLEPESPAIRAELAAAEDRAATIGARGLEGSDPLCALALETFAGIYGAEAGDMALRLLARGGIRIVGGIAPKILPVLRSAAFAGPYRDKGRLLPVIRTIPVHVCLEPRAGLLGAAREAVRLLSGPEED